MRSETNDFGLDNTRLVPTIPPFYDVWMQSVIDRLVQINTQLAALRVQVEQLKER